MSHASLQLARLSKTSGRKIFKQWHFFVGKFRWQVQKFLLLSVVEMDILLAVIFNLVYGLMQVLAAGA